MVGEEIGKKNDSPVFMEIKSRGEPPYVIRTGGSTESKSQVDRKETLLEALKEIGSLTEFGQNPRGGDISCS